MSRQQYTPEFRRRAIALLPESGKSVARMAQEPDIKENTLYNWKKLYQDKAGLLSPTRHSFPSRNWRSAVLKPKSLNRKRINLF
ncbi:transposase [Affinibrenneria salicis]|uniref:Transposase n=1 Tax=Affinibrenneria salicis TaxID=2590031 RepID=A0A5J5FQE7_9GAMM|nr:transposase [Affinibrenneria salicis]KAA8994542.1 transposase [Affinibrenneria salicis]